MNKYRVKFSHMVQLPISYQTNIPTKIIDVDDIYQVEPNVNIFALIYSMFNVIGSITVIAQEHLEEVEKDFKEKENDNNNSIQPS